VASQNTWQRATCQVDDSGEGVKFIVFDAPVINSSDLIKMSADGGTYPVLNATPTFSIPRVRAALVFAAEPYSYIAGVAARDDVVNVPGLSAQMVCEADGSECTELPYADGMTANAKALGIAESLLNQQFMYNAGGHLVAGDNGTQLSSVIGRVTIRHSTEGTSEEVDYSLERDRNVSQQGGVVTLHVPPERDFDRRAQLLNLLPGMRELREEARQMRLVGASLRQNPKLARTMLEAFAMAFGLDAMPAAAYVDPDMLDDTEGTPSTLAAGTPLFKESGDAVVLSPLGNPGDVVAVDPVFVGVTVLDGQRVDGPLHVTATGDNGVIFARVQGPVSTNDPVGLPSDDLGVQTYLTGAPKLPIGQVLAPVTDGVIELVPVRTNGAGGGDFHWQKPYKELDPTLGVAEGTFVYISPQNTLATVGMNDTTPGSPNNGAIITSTPGIWLALQAIPPMTDSGYYMPQDPVPGSGAEPPDNVPPLAGDLDNDAYPVFWLLWKSVC